MPAEPSPMALQVRSTLCFTFLSAGPTFQFLCFAMIARQFKYLFLRIFFVLVVLKFSLTH